MKRRDFMGLLGSAAALPLVARAQQPPKVHRIAVVHPSALIADMSETGHNAAYRAFFQELRRLGYVEGRNLVVERYSAEGGGQQRYAELAAKVVHTNPDVIFAISSSLVLSFKSVTSTIPVVGFLGDPIVFGIVTNLARPGGNITGVTVDAGLEIWGKRLQILREVLPTVTKVGFLTIAPWGGAQTTALQEAARQAGISLLGPALESPINETEYRRVLGAMAQQSVDGLIVGDSSANFTYGRIIVDLVGKARLPTIYPSREHFELGGLIAYASSPAADLWRRLAGYIDQILTGASPGDIAIYQEAKFSLLVNLKAAKALGLIIPPSLLARADEVIE